MSALHINQNLCSPEVSARDRTSSLENIQSKRLAGWIGATAILDRRHVLLSTFVVINKRV